MEKLNNEFKKMSINDKKNSKKNSKKNKKKENYENKINSETPEDPKKELTEEEKFMEEISNIKEKVRDLKIIISQNEQKNKYEDKLENFILIEKIVDYSKIKQKLFECFPTEDIFNYLAETWFKILNFSGLNATGGGNGNNEIKVEIIEENLEDFEEKRDKKQKNRSLGYYFNKLLMNLDFFIPKIITNGKDDIFKDKISESFFKNIKMIKNIEDSENFLYYFINVFKIKENLKLKIEKEKEIKEQITEIIRSYIIFGLNLVNILDLQEIFPLKTFFSIISDNYFLISYHIYSLLVSTYVKNDENKKFLIIDYLFELIKDNKNLVNYQLVYEIINNDFKNDKKRNELILKFIENIKIRFDKPIRINTVENVIYYCKLVFENSDLFTKKEIDQASEYICEQYFNGIKPKDWKNNLKTLNLFEYNDLKKYLSLDNLETFYFQLPMNSVETFIKILKFMPKEVPKLLNEYKKEQNYDAGASIIKKLDIPDHKIPEFFEKERIYKFFNYKIAACKDDNNPYTLIEYCLISQKTFDVAILQLLNKYKKFYFKDKFFLYVINEVYYGAFDKKFKFNKNTQRQIEELYKNIKYVDNYTFDDHFGPIEKNCIQIDQKKTNVQFIDDICDFENILKKYFANSECVGIDTEWRQCFKVKDEVDISIMQLATDDEKCCIILDMLKLRWEDKFFEIFKKYFKGKIFVGFSFDKNDMDVMPDELKDFFQDKNSCTVHDLVVLYKQKYLEKCQSLKIVTESLLKKPICKYEQCSDWNKRPLSKCQIHYAALDALICITLYNKIVEN